jgi:hypothetical protein
MGGIENPFSHISLILLEPKTARTRGTHAIPFSPIQSRVATGNNSHAQKSPILTSRMGLIFCCLILTLTRLPGRSERRDDERLYVLIEGAADRLKVIEG